MPQSIPKTVWTDWPAFTAVVSIPIAWLVAFVFPYTVPDPVTVPIAIPVVANFICAAFLAWRLYRVARLFAHGGVAQGIVTSLSIRRDRGRLFFSFDHMGQTVHSWTPVHKTKSVLALKRGHSVEVLYDPDRPKRAIVRHLYERRP